MLVIAVGEDSEWGRTMAMVVGDTPDTPLQEKLTDLAAAISKVGLAVAVLAFCVLMIRWAPSRTWPPYRELFGAYNKQICWD